jgi:hypothetical protein
MLIFRSLKNKIEDEIIGKIIHLTTFTLSLSISTENVYEKTPIFYR